MEGATNDFWKTTYFESISEDEFNRMDHKDHVNIESITVHKSNAGLWLTGIDVKLTDNDPSLGLNTQIISRGRIEVAGDDTKMNLYDYNPKKIELEKFEEDGFPSGMQFFADDSVDQPSLGILAREIANSHQSEALRPSKIVPYAQLDEFQELIGVYGYVNKYNVISTLGFIIREERLA